MCPGFGVGAAVDLNLGISEAVPGWYAVTSPPTIVGGVAIVGAQVKGGGRPEMRHRVLCEGRAHPMPYRSTLTGRFLLIALIGLHVRGALAEHLVFGQNTLLRMFRTEANLSRKVVLPQRKR